MNEPVLILYLEDDPRDVELVRDKLQQIVMICELQVASDRAEYEAALTQRRFDLILSDYKLPSYDGMAALALARAKQPDVPFILVSGAVGEEQAMDCVLRGATDSVHKQRIGRLVPAVLRALAETEEHQKRKEAEESLRKSEEQFRTVVTTAPDAIFIQIHGGFAFVNAATLDLFGAKSEDDLLGKAVMDRIHPDSRAMVAERLRQLNELRHNLSRIEEKYLRLDGSPVDVEVSAVPFIFAGEHGALVFVRDITQRKQAEDSLRAAKETAEAANHVKDHLLATVSHELRTPLTPVLVMLSMMQEDPQVPAPLLKDIAMMRGRIELEARLIDGLLDLTRMTRGKLLLKSELVDAHALLDHALAVAVQDADAGRPAIHWELKATDHFVWADPTRLQQVCWNIMKNALQYTPDSGTVHIRSQNTADGRLELEFADTGAGIDPQFLPRIFNEFERGPRASRHRAGGLGLGLSIAKSLVEQLGGSVEAASRGPGQGSTFTVRLPVADHQMMELQDELHPPAPAPTDVAVPSLRVLLVKDDADTSDAVSLALQRMGYHVSIAATVSEALATGAREKFDLLLCDIGLPDGSGLEVMRWFGKHQSIPGIALSGYAAPADLERSQNVGFAMHLIKPIAIGALRAAIQEVHASTSKAETVPSAI